MANDVIEKQFNEIIPKEDIEFLIKFDEYKKRAAVIEDHIKEKAHEFLEKNNLLEEGYTQNGVHIYETKPYKKKSVDTKALKEQGLYESFAKDVWVKGSVRWQIEYEND